MPAFVEYTYRGLQPEFVSVTVMDMQQVENLTKLEDRVQNLGDAHFNVYCWRKM